MRTYHGRYRTHLKKRRLTLECDEMWSFVGHKQSQAWIWLALDRDTREIVGVAIGTRDQVTARELWMALPAVYRQCAVCYTDFGSVIRFSPRRVY
jgi:IS1 family transposase